MTTFRDARQISGGTCRPASFVQLVAGEPQQTEPDSTPTWVARGANFVVAASQVAPGAELCQQDIPDESMLLLSPAVPVTVTAGAETQIIADEALAILPPGSARITAHAPGLVVRIFSSAATAWAALANNAEAYFDETSDVTPLAYWPQPTSGLKLRVYRLDKYRQDDAFGRIFRSTNLMVNIFEPSAAARDLAALSPHDHVDFEQGSLTIEGDFTHYLRTPWGRDRSLWRADEALDCSGCSLMVIPPGMIHTTSWASKGARLVDIFSPPRDDFSLKPGWIRNADDYPPPARLRRGS